MTNKQTEDKVYGNYACAVFASFVAVNNERVKQNTPRSVPTSAIGCKEFYNGRCRPIRYFLRLIADTPRLVPTSAIRCSLKLIADTPRRVPTSAISCWNKIFAGPALGQVGLTINSASADARLILLRRQGHWSLCSKICRWGTTRRQCKSKSHLLALISAQRRQAVRHLTLCSLDNFFCLKWAWQTLALNNASSVESFNVQKHTWECKLLEDYNTFFALSLIWRSESIKIWSWPSTARV